MSTVLTYLVSLIVIMMSVMITLYFKSELERMFREKKEIFAFHVCNVLIILMASFAVHAVADFMLQNKINYLLQMAILLIMIIPIYIIGHFAFEKYKFINRKYLKSENGKVLVINEKYLRRR
ncbi:hypothetical protein [Bacillus sp. FJAT-27445]|uniref:hypothetical protein n=1 Tax=Bacillus sp. FJAT-27445 TaxID=1679166 RepID=UPI000743A434|nr:hypothetical protein [Bacillus sp. FJAT-27445]